MKVLHVIPSVGPLRGGPSMMMRTLTRGLARTGLDVHVATTDDNGPDRLPVAHAKPQLEADVTYWYFPRQTRFYTFSWPLSRWLARHVRDYDLLHIHALFSYAATPAAFWAHRYGIPYIIRPLGTLNRWGMQNRHPWLKKLSFRLIERRILASAVAIHYTSEQERLEAVELGVMQQSVIIPNAVDVAGNSRDCVVGRFRARYPQLADRIVILFLSRLDPIKGLDLLLPAFAQVRERHPHTALVLVGNGDPDFVASLRQQAVRLGINSDILWTGFLDGEDKCVALTDADIFALPSYSESFGVAAVEAMAFGLPVVVSDQVGIHREIAKGQAGAVVPCRTEELALALLQLIRDPRLRSQMGENGRSLVHRHFSLDMATDRLIETYMQICRGHKNLVSDQVAEIRT